ncbi:MAG: type II secretion system F family protein [Patescibacteria group bacterium]
MPKFKYKVRAGATGEETSGIAAAVDRFSLAAELKGSGKFIISIEESKSITIPGLDFIDNFLGRVKMHELIVFYHNLSIMMSAGLSLSRVLSILERQTKNKKFKETILGLAQEINRGNTLSSGMGKHPTVFEPLVVSMVRAGEESGNLSEVLKVVGDQLEKSYLLKKKIKGALIYPVVVISVMILIGLLMFVYVVPTLTATFKELNVALPTSTKVIIWISDFLNNHALLGVVLLIASVIAVKMWLGTKTGHRLFEKALFHLPIVGSLVRQSNSARTTRTLSSLLSSGVDMLEAITITRDVLQNSFYKDALKVAGERVQKGITLSSVFAEYEHIYPLFVGEMVEVGEETGKLSDMLMNVALFYEDEVDSATKNMTTIIEPLLMVVVGGGVGFFAVSMITPMYSLLSGI